MKNIIYLALIFLAGWLGALQAQDNITVDDVITGKATVKAKTSITLKAGFHAVAGSDFHAYIDPNITTTTANPTADVVSVKTVSGTPTPTGQNYVRSISFREAHSSMPTGSYAHTEEIQYFDGLGRPSQVIQVNASPLGHDMVQPIVYDGFGREEKKYLPYVQGDNNGAFVGDAIAQCETFYSGTIEGKDPDSKPYAFTDFEDSPLNRINSQFGAGNTWHEINATDGTKGKTSYNYTTNQNEIASWDEKGDGVPYPAYSLYITEITDENGHVTKEYKDKLGQVVLKESINGSETLQTHYIYDDFGLLRTVVPPLASSPDDKDLCYFYTYDGRKRMISKDIPGAGIVYMVYDKRDRLVLTQDANMREVNPNKYIFTKYDQLNRPVMTGKITIAESLSTIRSNFANYSSSMYETYDGSTTCYGYSKDNSYPDGYDISKDDILTVTWYDDKDYGFITNLSLNTALNFNTADMPTGYVQNKSTKTKGAAIGTLVKALPVAGSGLTMANTNLVTVSYFDDYGNVIMSTSTNH
ncbi:DUF6443 domain-containing protein, partial [Plebeiibacterium marinum]